MAWRQTVRSAQVSAGTSTIRPSRRVQDPRNERDYTTPCRNVGSNVGVTYTANNPFPPVCVTVSQKLQFTATQQTQEYEVTFATQRVASVTQKYSFGSVVWSDGEHMVTSPIAIILPAASQVAVM
ncbi:hypothetical protein PR202_ga02953 [Eleusine coracana subsp. coracana]|uniref:Subtilisin-like protease fibronectin type-III domain-containing protein n=1 Tax=Eleusine coracana subsp. coracana TaxID=191504 RepID=A0AAV5BLD0_ELECO|nr:hypothetical protein PR202_ga02953 [Eleusine coracana subsp. coracana]